ncbi:MAG TPA: hydrogenase maturation nickel metallochaperone HypA [Steroidobacteraceae bacterium]|nr:hydrogenase maturation nickel metallochaperone HypA [Steroidobacteraceae bacterium]
MHELSICQALLAQVAGVAREQQARRIIAITVRIGPLSGVEPALLESAYPLASAGTPAANAALIIERPGVRVRCRECGAECEVSASSLLCTACGGWRTELLSGDELLLARVELER